MLYLDSRYDRIEYRGRFVIHKSYAKDVFKMNSEQCVPVDVVSQDESRREKEWSNMSLQAAAALMSNLCLDKTQCLHNNLPNLLLPPHSI